MNAPFIERARALVGRMSLTEKLRMLAGRGGLHAALPFTYHLLRYNAPGNRRLGIPGIRFTDGPSGVVMGRSVCFPSPIGRGASFDPDLEEAVGRALGQRAQELGANTLGAVCVNLVRHPAGGRSQESFGAEPFHVGRMGAALTRGISRHAMAVVKHFALNSMENARFTVDVRADERTLREVFLPHFKACVDAGASGVMTAYNRVNGRHCDLNAELVQKILKDDWGFSGFVISDFLLGVHATAASLNAGLDLEMPQAFFFSLPALLTSLAAGAISRNRVDEAAARLVGQQVRMGLVGKPRERRTRPPVSDEHRNLARLSAQKSIVLLKNENNRLPIRPGQGMKIAVFGNAARRGCGGSLGSVAVRPPYWVTPLEGLRRKGQGATIVFCPEGGRYLQKARRLAVEADVCLVFAGIAPRDEGEYFPFLGGGDRKTLALPQTQQRLIEEIARAGGKAAVVLSGGSAVCKGPWADCADAVLMTWYAGMEGGNAIADVLFGNVNPGGKLPLTFPHSDGELFPFDPGAKQVQYDYHHDYRYYDHKGFSPWYAFGHGLSYTEFSYANLKLNERSIRPDGALDFSLSLANTGKRAGDEVVQVYVGLENSRVSPRSKKELKAFQRVTLTPGEERELSFRIPAQSLAVYDPARKSWFAEEMEYSLLAGSSSADIRLRAMFSIAR
ncbi:MAG: glycoside hydrolase family 3 C-terminal domain-containing protein [Thermodesulfobacteriota bacterium]